MNGHWAICRPPGALAPHLNKFMGNSFHDLIKYVYFAFWTNTFCYLDRNTIEWGKACGWPRRAIWRARLLMEVHQSETAALFGILIGPWRGHWAVGTKLTPLLMCWMTQKWCGFKANMCERARAPVSWRRVLPHPLLITGHSSTAGQPDEARLGSRKHIHMCIHKYIYIHKYMSVYKYTYTCGYVHKYIYSYVTPYLVK